MLDILVIFVVTAVCSGIAVGLILIISHRKSWYDQTNDRKVHSGHVPRLGGIGFAVVFVIGAVFIVALTRKFDSVVRFLPCLAGICIIAAAGAWDDFRPVKPLFKLLTQIAAALCVVIPGYTFRRIVFFDNNYLENIRWLSYFVTVVWIVGLTNAMNFIDGLDGLAGGISAIIALTFAFIFSRYGETPSAAMLCVCLFGAIVGFLLYNVPVPQAKIFMGDGGSQFLGFTLALLPLLEEHNTAAALPVPYAAALLAIPIFDTTAAVWRRVRDKKWITTPDRGHIHHKLMNLGLSAPKIDIIMMCLQLALSVLVYISLKLPSYRSLLVLGLAYLLALAFFATLHFLNRKVLLAAGENGLPNCAGHLNDRGNGLQRSH